MEITVLCRIVDNFGDIGVVWRLSRLLKNKYPEVKVNLIVDDLPVFKKIWPQVSEEEDLQIIENINIYNWNSYDFCYNSFKENSVEKDKGILEIILECFQCGRPDWMEKILFDEALERTVQIIMIDYLTAEKYAEDFHKLLSLTRRAKVKKVNFMPGFTDKTGGLIIDEQWKNLKPRNKNGDILFFTYDKPSVFWEQTFAAIENYAHNKTVLIANGKGKDSFISAVNKYNPLFNCKELSFLKQTEWDKMVQNCSVLFIRGEESLSRSCLAGIPFIWHAYPQTEEYQMVKMNALLERMKRHFIKEDFAIVEKAWQTFNKPEEEFCKEDCYKAIKDFVDNADRLEGEFRGFSESLLKNGDLIDNLMTFIKEICII